jgi:hypothetical protein
MKLPIASTTLYWVVHWGGLDCVKASWTYLFRMIKVLSCLTAQSPCPRGSKRQGRNDGRRRVRSRGLTG